MKNNNLCVEREKEESIVVSAIGGAILAGVLTAGSPVVIIVGSIVGAVVGSKVQNGL